MNKYTIVKDNQGNLKRVEAIEDGKEKITLERGKQVGGQPELPSDANWRAIEKKLNRKREGK